MNAQITIYTSGKTTQTRIYAGDFERLTQNGTTTSYQYIYSPDGLVGIYVKPSNGTAEMHYAVTDHLGSLLALYKSNFTQTYAASYDAWGKQTISKNTLNLRRGYCLHEHWNEFDLIDMNGRFYDPSVGRFLSPDPYVQDITNLQNYNAYSYCLNNPLKYTDPSGEFCVGAVIFGAIAGLYMGGVLANDSYNPIKWDYSSGKTWRYMGWGAIVGAASGYIGAEIATSGCAFANTTSIAMSSLINSVGTAAYTNGKTNIGISFGAFSIDLTNSEIGFLGKKGNSKLENCLYGLGALANVSDVLAGVNPGEVELRTENNPIPPLKKDIIGHSQLVDANGNAIIDWGPAEGYSVNKINQIVPGTNSFEDGAISFSKMKWNPVAIKCVNTQRINWFSSVLDKGGKYNFAFNSCVSQTSRALNMSGVFNVGIHPYLLHAQMYLRSIGIRPCLSYYYFQQ